MKTFSSSLFRQERELAIVSERAFFQFFLISTRKRKHILKLNIPFSSSLFRLLLRPPLGRASLAFSSSLFRQLIIQDPSRLDYFQFFLISTYRLAMFQRVLRAFSSSLFRHLQGGRKWGHAKLSVLPYFDSYWDIMVWPFLFAFSSSLFRLTIETKYMGVWHFQFFLISTL